MVSNMCGLVQAKAQIITLLIFLISRHKQGLCREDIGAQINVFQLLANSKQAGIYLTYS